MRRRAKIIATIGPTSSSTKVLRSLVEAGMDVARLHGNTIRQRALPLIDPSNIRRGDRLVARSSSDANHQVTISRSDGSMLWLLCVGDAVRPACSLDCLPVPGTGALACPGGQSRVAQAQVACLHWAADTRVRQPVLISFRARPRTYRHRPSRFPGAARTRS